MSAEAAVFPAGRDGLIGFTPAKVNLFLDVLGKRPDGFHDVETLLASIDLYDTIEARRRSDDALTLVCEPPTVPNDGRNLVLMAAEALRMQTGTRFGADLRLVKRVPQEAGLGGGSSDAALTLVLLNRLWNLGQDRDRLLHAAAAVGSDVGFFLDPQAAWCTGRGENVVPVTLPTTLNLVLVKPPMGLSTAAVYRNLILDAPPVSSAAMRSASSLPNLIAAMHNRLQPPAFAAAPAVAAHFRTLLNCNPQAAMLSGSGSSLFAVAEDRPDAERIALEFRAAAPDCRVFVVRCPAPAFPSATSASSHQGVPR